MTGADHIPGSQNGRMEAAVAEKPFALGAGLDIGFHHRGWLRHAHIDEVRNVGGLRRGDGGAGRDQIYVAKLASLPGGGVGDAHEVHERTGGTHVVLEGFAIQRIAEDDLALDRQSLGRVPAPRERLYSIATREQSFDQARAQIAGAAGDKDPSWEWGLRSCHHVGSIPRKLAIADPVWPVGFFTEALLPVTLVFAVVTLEPHDFA